ncbi:RES family NAD+ phosphorylase [Parasalinivibrio latis]|uniref:RES family NAD+ phosphorylase n=1 Tax=Parasalinivibrio latis TaxID=2952610 RepID=UPI0030DF7744
MSKPKDAEIRKKLGVADSVPVLRHAPTQEEISSKGFLERMSECFGVKGWMWKDWKGRLLAIIFLPPAIASPINYWYPKLELAYEYSSPYIQAAGAAIDDFSADFIAFSDSSSPFDGTCDDSGRLILCPQPVYKGPEFSGGLIHHDRLHLYRIVKTSYASDPLASASHLFNGRWHSAGSQVLYTATDMVQAVGELMNAVPNEIRDSGQFSLIEMVASGSAASVPIEGIPGILGNPQDMSATRNIGDRWISARESLMLFVPSMLQPEKVNVVLNRAHPEFSGVEVIRVQPLTG